MNNILFITFFIYIQTNYILSLPVIRNGQFFYPHEPNYDPLETAEKLRERMEKIDENDVTRFYTDQTLDHFDRQNTETFEQRWFINDTWWNYDDHANSPIFLCVGGEGPPLDATVVSNSVHCSDMTELAPKHNALILAIEHRYYGMSIPNDDLSTENLKYLSSDQALADIAQFVNYINSEYNLDESNRWITWGGSYPGMMSGFARLKYPNLIYGSVSSSSPWQAQVNMPEYNNIVATGGLSAPIVGGSPRCLEVIVEGHKEVGKLLQSPEGISKLNDLFNFCHPAMLKNEKNAAIWSGNGVVYIPSQENDPSCTTELCNIEKICDYVEGTDHGFHFVERLASLSKIQHYNQCIRLDADASFRFWSNERNRDRSWEYQTATEWGFYTTCEEGSECPYTQTSPDGYDLLDYWIEVQQVAFNIDEDQIKKGVEFSNLTFGGNDPKGTRILFPNGSVDPWSGLGVVKSSTKGEEENAFMVEGSSHHFWTHESLPTDQKTVQIAREKIWATVDAWLQLEE